MAKKTKGEWPYHEDRHGNWVACSSNPCKLHSGGDIMATSPEDAFAKADRLAHPQGGEGMTGMDDVKAHWRTKNKGAEDAYKAAQERSRKRRRSNSAMKGFYEEPLADVPDNLKTGWHHVASVGGKYPETRYMFKGQVAKLMRHDIEQFRKEGGMPKDWDVKVLVRPDKTKGEGFKDDEFNASDFYIIVTRPSGSTPASRSMQTSDIYDPNKEGSKIGAAEDLLDKEVGIRNCSYRNAVDFCESNPDARIPTDERTITEHNLGRIGDQYSMATVNDDLLYVYTRDSDVVFIDEDHKDPKLENDKSLQYFRNSRRGQKPSSGKTE